MKGRTATVLAFVALLLALFTSHVNASPLNRRLLQTSGQCNLDKLTDLSGNWNLRKDGTPIVAETCCPQKVSFLWQDCQSKGLTPQPNTLCAIVVVADGVMVPRGEVLSSYNPLETRPYGNTFTWYVDRVDVKFEGRAVKVTFRIWRYDTYRPSQKLYVAANLSGSKVNAVVSPFAFQWEGPVNGDASPCKS